MSGFKDLSLSPSLRAHGYLTLGENAQEEVRGGGGGKEGGREDRNNGREGGREERRDGGREGGKERERWKDGQEGGRGKGKYKQRHMYMYMYNEACNSLGCKWPSFRSILGLISCTCAVHTHIHVQSYK